MSTSTATSNSLHPPRSAPWRAAGLLILCLAVFNANLRNIGSYDTLAAGLLPFQLVRGDGMSLDAYGGLPHQIAYSLIQSRSGHWVSLYPVVTPLLVTPLYLPTFLIKHLDHGGRPTVMDRLVMEKAAASLIAALSVVVLFLTLRRITSPAAAWWLALAYAFATSTWTIASQSLWQHGAGELFLACALYLLVEPHPRGWRAALLGLLCGLLVANRPNDLFLAAAIAWITLRRSGRDAWPVLATGGVVAAILCAYNLHEFGTFLGGYGRYQLASGEHMMEVAHGPDLKALAALLVGNRGLLVFSPFLLALVAVRGSRLATTSEERWTLAAAWAATCVFYSCFPGSPGGSCYGPRYLTDCLPILFVLLADAWERLGRFTRPLFAAGVAFAVVLQGIGAFYFPAGWSNLEQNGIWTLDHSGPVLAARHGPVSPFFLSLLAPRLTTAAPLAAGENRGQTLWREPPPSRWLAGATRPLAVTVVNDGFVRWSSLGGRIGFYAVRLLVEWRPFVGQATAPPRAGLPPDGESDYWLSWRLLPGEQLARRVLTDAPHRPGRYLLVVQPAQVGPLSWLRFADGGAVPATWPVEVVAPEGPVTPGAGGAPRRPGGSPTSAAAPASPAAGAARGAAGSARSAGASP